MKNVNQKVRDLLVHFSQKELAEKVGVSQATISDLNTDTQKDIGVERGGRKIDALHEEYCPDKQAA
jgi:DNA-binding XRE family transcriptional regulator